MSSEANFFDIYNHRILDLAGNIPRQGRLAAPGATANKWPKEITPFAAQPASQNTGMARAWLRPTASATRLSARAGIKTAVARKSAVRFANTP